MKYLFAGLGNIGEEYAGTRHNIGFDILDSFAEKHSGQFKQDRYADYAACRYRGKSIHLIKPSTYVNRSGKAVRFWADKLDIPLNQIVIVLDDLALPYGKLRLKAKGHDGGHNGLKDINQLLGTTKYPRLRFGIGDEFQKGKQVDYVLGKWSISEREKMPELINRSVETLEGVIFSGIERAMNKFN